jgi:hypothetical protein
LLIEAIRPQCGSASNSFHTDKIRAEGSRMYAQPSLEMINAQVGQQISEWFQPSLCPSSMPQ